MFFLLSNVGPVLNMCEHDLNRYIPCSSQMTNLIFVQDKEYMEYMVRKLKEEYKLWGLKINLNSTECRDRVIIES